MRKRIGALILAGAIAACSTVGWAENAIDLSSFTDEEITTLYKQIQEEIVARGIEKTAKLPKGNYIGGEDIPVGKYKAVVDTSETDLQFAEIDICSADTDPKDYEHFKQVSLCTADEAVHVQIEEGDQIFLTGPFTLTISTGVLFE